MNKSLLTLAVLSSLAFALSSCNTIAGIGEDIAQGGQGINNVAHKTSKAMNKQTSSSTTTNTAPAKSSTPTKQG